METQIRVPAIITDIDGVLVLGKNLIPNADTALKLLRQPLNKLDPLKFGFSTLPLPFMCLTNAGGITEQTKADSLNRILSLHEEHEKLKANHIVVNHTPIQGALRDLKDKTILLSGVGKLADVAESLGLNKWLTVDEYCTLFPYLVPVSHRKEEDALLLRPAIKSRLGIVDDELFEHPFQIGAIVILNDTHKWDEAVQVFCDLLSSEDGRIAEKHSVIKDETWKHIPIYCCTNDLLYGSPSSICKLPRIAGGGLIESFKNMARLIYGREPAISLCGKPQLMSFKYIEEVVKQQFQSFEISNFYMIGDNPKSDIKGANTAKWNSILVRSGLYKGKENDEENPATYLVDDFQHAVRLIFELEGIKSSQEICLV